MPANLDGPWGECGGPRFTMPLATRSSEASLSRSRDYTTTQRALDRAQRGFELLGDLPQGETLQVGPSQDLLLQGRELVDPIELAMLLTVPPRWPCPEASRGRAGSPSSVMFVGPDLLSTETVDGVPLRDEHHPGHQLGVVGSYRSAVRQSRTKISCTASSASA